MAPHFCLCQPAFPEPVPYSSLSMKLESNKLVYFTPEVEEVVLSIEAPIATSQTEPIDDDPEEHPWS